jgi:hypothetical protein
MRSSCKAGQLNCKEMAQLNTDASAQTKHESTGILQILHTSSKNTWDYYPGVQPVILCPCIARSALSNADGVANSWHKTGKPQRNHVSTAALRGKSIVLRDKQITKLQTKRTEHNYCGQQRQFALCGLATRKTCNARCQKIRFPILLPPNNLIMRCPFIHLLLTSLHYVS